MSSNDNKQLDELQALMIQLGETVASNERRTARLERVMRWGLFSGLGALGIALAITLNPLSNAVAQQGLTDVQRLVNALDGIKTSLDNLNIVGMMQQAAVQQAMQEARQMVKEAPAVSQQVVTQDPAGQPKGEPMYVTCGRMTQAGDTAIQQLKARYPLGAGALAYFCQIDPDLKEVTEQTLSGFGEEQYQQAVMAGTLRTMATAGGLVNNLHEVTTMFGQMAQGVWTKVLTRTKDEVMEIVVTNKLPDYCQPMPPEQAEQKKLKIAQLRIQYPLGSYMLSYLCQTYPGISNLDESTVQLIWQEHRDEYQNVLMQASADTLVDIGTLVFRIREDSDKFRQFLLEPPAAASLDNIRYQLGLLNRTLATIPVMSAQMEAMRAHMGVMAHSMGSTAGRMGSWMPW